MGKKTDPIVPSAGRLGLLGRFWVDIAPAHVEFLSRCSVRAAYGGKR